MLPRYHIILGAIFTLVFWLVFPWTAWYYIALIFLSSFLIDFDHYVSAVLETERLSLPNAFDYYRQLDKEEEVRKRKKIFRKGHFYIIHTLEFHVFVLALGLVFTPFLYVLAGMIFHSILDLIELAYTGERYRRWFFFSEWAWKKLNNSI